MDCSAWVEDFLCYLGSERASSEATIENYGDSLGRFGTFFRNLDEGLAWDNVDEDVVRRWVVELMGAGMAPRTVSLHLSALRSFYRYLKLTGRVTRNPMTRVASPKAEKPLPKFFRDDDINTLLDRLKEAACGGDADDMQPEAEAVRRLSGRDDYERARAYLIILLLYMTGMRVGELHGLDVQDVDIGQMQVRVTGKRNKQRIIPIGSEIVEAMAMYLPLRAQRVGGEETTRALLIDRKGGRYSVSALENLVRKLTGTVTTQERRSPHVFRHTFATSMLNQGCDMQSVKELLGHANLATTQVYTHTNFEELRRIYNEAHPRG